jgi:hypothetical protein
MENDPGEQCRAETFSYNEKEVPIDIDPEVGKYDRPEKGDKHPANRARQ